ncbi:hypothetical protein RMR21_025845 (plasmid) [Agrobacterium sp. rho-8.1]|nr:Imm40 family immunity protein [Agrobacterium sp. rho-8.1]
MPVVYSTDADAILSTGVWLGPDRTNWALTKEQALVAIGKLRDAKCILLGGDVLNGPGKNFSHTYDNWYFELSSPPSPDDLSLSALKASSYISDYPVEDAYFVLVPRSA